MMVVYETRHHCIQSKPKCLNVRGKMPDATRASGNFLRMRVYTAIKAGPPHSRHTICSYAVLVLAVL